MSTSLASSLGLAKIASTDTIREVLRTQISSTARPALHRSSFEPAGGSATEDWKETVQALSGVLAVIERAISKELTCFWKGFIISQTRRLLTSGGRLAVWPSELFSMSPARRGIEE